MADDAQLVAALAAFGVMVFFAGLSAWTRRRRQVGRMRQFMQVRARSADGGEAGQKARDTSAIVVGLNRRLGASSMAKQLQIQMVRSGLSLTPNQFLLGQVAAGSLLFLVGQYVLFGEQGFLALPLSLGLAAPALVVPRFGLQFLQNRRVGMFENQLAPAVDVMAGALQAGASLPQSFEMVSREMANPIGEEFGRLIQESAFAIPLDQALVNMVERVPSMDLEMLVTAINIQYRVGGNLSHILKTIAHTIRERVRIRGELRTLTAQARLSSYIISGMPVVVVLALFVVSPSYIIKLFDPGVTRIMLLGGIMGIVCGFYVMKRIADIEV